MHNLGKAAAMKDIASCICNVNTKEILEQGAGVKRSWWWWRQLLYIGNRAGRAGRRNHLC